MTELPPSSEPQDPDKWRWLKDIFKFGNRKGSNKVSGTDGPTSPNSSGLTPGQGINQTPDLRSGASGGGTNPGVDPKKGTT